MPSGFPASYRPDETPEQIFSEHLWLQGAFLGAIAYGIQVILYVQTCFFLWKLREPANRKQNIFFIAYISIIFVLATLYMVGLLQFTQDSFIDGRNIPGGPDAFENIMFSLPIDMLANVIMVLTSWMCDIINVWRCFVIYKGCRVPSWIVNFVPILLYLGSIAFGILFLKQVGTVSQSPWDSAGINFTIPYYTMSLALNIIVTVLIVLRLLVYRHRIVRAMGKGHGSHYTSLAAMIIESAAINSAFSLLFLIPFAFNSPIAQLFLQGLAMVQGVSTFLIIFRVATGKGWSQQTYTSKVQAISTNFTTRTTQASVIPNKSRASRNPNSSNVLSSCENGLRNPDGETIMLSPISSSTSDWLSPKRSLGNIEITKHILVEEERS